MRNYLDLLDRVLTHGQDLDTHTGPRRTVFAANLEYDLSAGFPMVTTRKIRWANVVHELIWFLNGETNTKYLTDNGVHIWDGNAAPDGNVGPIYGHQWRNFNSSGVDQITRAIRLLRSRVHTTRNVIIAWNPEEQQHMRLPPCHWGFQLFTDGSYVSMLVSMRSSDVALGTPTNIASYALLTEMFAKLTDKLPGMLHMSLGDVHLYADHLDTARIQLQRDPLPLPTVEIQNLTPDLRNLHHEDFHLVGYQHHPVLTYKLIT